MLTTRLRDAGIHVKPADDEAAAHAAAGFQLLNPHRPETVTFPTGSDQVAAAVRVAADLGIPYAVTNTGHGRRRAQEGGLLISLSRLRTVTVDPSSQRVRIGGGARWADVVARTAPAGLMVPHGSAPGVGVVGYLLGGGYSIYGRHTGLAANALHSMTIVTEDGNVKRVEHDTIRGLLAEAWRAPAEVGIVTEVELDVSPAPSLTGGGFLVAADDAHALLSAFPAWAEPLPESITPSLGLMRYPDHDGVPAPLRSQVIGHVRLTAVDDDEVARSAASALSRGLHILDDDLARMDWADAGRIYREPDTPRPHIGDNCLTDNTPRLDTLWPALSDTGDQRVIFDVRRFGGRLTFPEAGGLAAPGEWMLSLISPVTGALPNSFGKTQRHLDQAVTDPVGTTANFTYGPGSSETNTVAS